MLNQHLFIKIKKLFWTLSLRNSIQDRVFLPFTRPKNVLRIIPAPDISENISNIGYRWKSAHLEKPLMF